jgi:predicted transposase YbfD/YdcC
MIFIATILEEMDAKKAKNIIEQHWAYMNFLQYQLNRTSSETPLQIRAIGEYWR